MAPAMSTYHGWMHVACGAPVDEPDVLQPKWIALIYAVMLVPFVQPISFMVRRGLVMAWRDRFPRRVAQLRVHGAVADLTTFFALVLCVCAFILWIAWRVMT